MKVLVTGSSGFIGSELSDYLLSKPEYAVIGIDKQEPVKTLNHVDFRKTDLSLE